MRAKNADNISIEFKIHIHVVDQKQSHHIYACKYLYACIVEYILHNMYVYVVPHTHTNNQNTLDIILFERERACVCVCLLFAYASHTTRNT